MGGVGPMGCALGRYVRTAVGWSFVGRVGRSVAPLYLDLEQE
jgi:hypothetical protein